MSKKSLIEQHLSRWQNNRKYLECLDPAYPEWAVAITFYASLHLVQAWLSRQGQHPRSHKARNQVLNRMGSNRNLSSDQRKLVRDLTVDYTTLREASIHARYEPEVTKYTDIESVQEELIDDLLQSIEDKTRKLFGGTSAVPVADLPKLKTAS